MLQKAPVQLPVIHHQNLLGLHRRKRLGVRQMDSMIQVQQPGFGRTAEAEYHLDSHQCAWLSGGFNADRTAHHLRQRLGDGKPQSGVAVDPSIGILPMGEGVKQQFRLIRRNPDAAVLY
ncbi:hypothetical protein D3C75_1053540 [compost metagenome]